MPVWLVMWLIQHCGWMWAYATPEMPSHAVAQVVHTVQHLVC
jgi:hypothetical protein